MSISALINQGMKLKESGQTSPKKKNRKLKVIQLNNNKASLLTLLLDSKRREKRRDDRTAKSIDYLYTTSMP
jgi:hypothetical protein